MFEEFLDKGAVMLKWKILAVLGLTFGVAGIVWGYAQEKKAAGFFELRVYSAQPGKRDALRVSQMGLRPSSPGTGSPTSGTGSRRSRGNEKIAKDG